MNPKSLAPMISLLLLTLAVAPRAQELRVSEPMSAEVFMGLQGFLKTPAGGSLVWDNPDLKPLLGILSMDQDLEHRQALGALSASLPAGFIQRREAGKSLDWEKILPGAYRTSVPKALTELRARSLALVQAAAADEAKTNSLWTSAETLRFYSLYGREAQAYAASFAQRAAEVRTMKHAHDLARALQDVAKTAPGEGVPVVVEENRSPSEPGVKLLKAQVSETMSVATMRGIRKGRFGLLGLVDPSARRTLKALDGKTFKASGDLKTEVFPIALAERVSVHGAGWMVRATLTSEDRNHRVLLVEKAFLNRDAAQNYLDSLGLEEAAKGAADVYFKVNAEGSNATLFDLLRVERSSSRGPNGASGWGYIRAARRPLAIVSALRRSAGASSKSEPFSLPFLVGTGVSGLPLAAYGLLHYGMAASLSGGLGLGLLLTGVLYNAGFKYGMGFAGAMIALTGFLMASGPNKVAAVGVGLGALAANALFELSARALAAFRSRSK